MIINWQNDTYTNINSWENKVSEYYPASWDYQQDWLLWDELSQAQVIVSSGGGGGKWIRIYEQKYVRPIDTTIDDMEIIAIIKCFLDVVN